MFFSTILHLSAFRKAATLHQLRKSKEVLKQYTGRAKTLDEEASLYTFQLHLFADVSYHRVADIMPSVSLELIFRVSVGPVGLDGPTFREAGCK